MLGNRPDDADELVARHRVQRGDRVPRHIVSLTASARIRAASAMSSIRLSSSGLWLIPSLLATKIIAAGRNGARITASCSAPLAVSGSDVTPAFAAPARTQSQIFLS